MSHGHGRRNYNQFNIPLLVILLILISLFIKRPLVMIGLIVLVWILYGLGPLK